jgi:hypothetical protein
VRDEVQREVEWRDEGARADRYALRHPARALRALGDLEPEHLSARPERLVRGDLERVDEARDLAARVAHGLARLDREDARELVPALAEAPRCVEQDLLPRVRR